MSVAPGPKMTVVIPAYKAERTIQRAIDSVLSQPGCDPKVVIVVDGRLDGSEALVKARYGERVRVVVNERNRGVQYSRNAGLSLVEDPFVMFLDADDFLDPPILSALTDALMKSDADLAFGPMQVFDERNGRRGPITVLAGSAEDIFVGWLARGEFVGTSSVLWKTEFLRRIGGWDPELKRQEDGELVLRALLLGARHARSNGGRGIYVMHESPGRLTRRNDNLDSLLAVPEKLLALPNARFPAAVIQNACARSLYNAARLCLVRGAGQLGAEALSRSRALGFRGHLGNPIQRISSILLGLRASCWLERGVRRMTGKTV